MAFIIRIYHDARSSECEWHKNFYITVLVDLISGLKFETYTNKLDIFGVNFQTTCLVVRECSMYKGLVHKQERVKEKIEERKSKLQ